MKKFLVSFSENVGAILALILGIAFFLGTTAVLMFFVILGFRANIFVGLGVSFLFVCWIALLATIWENL